MSQYPIFFFSCAFFLGALVGLAELLSRYPWSIRKIGTFAAGMMYLAINGTVSFAAYCLAVDWELGFGLEARSEIWRVLLVGVMAMAVLRSAFANIRVGDKDVAAGFSMLLEVFLRRAERSLDQEIARVYLQDVGKLVEGLTYSGSRTYLVAVTEGVLRSVSQQELDLLKEVVAKVDELDVDDATKMVIFASRVIELTSLEVFTHLAAYVKSNLVKTDQTLADDPQKRLARLSAAKEFLRKHAS